MINTIPKEELEERHLYRLRSRNLTLGVWNPDRNEFIGIREKFTERFLDSEIFEHTAWALEALDVVLPDEIVLAVDLGSQDSTTGRPTAFSDKLKEVTGWGWHFTDGEQENDPKIRSHRVFNKPLFDFLGRHDGA